MPVQPLVNVTVPLTMVRGLIQALETTVKMTRVPEAYAGATQLGTQDVVGRVSQRVAEHADRFGEPGEAWIEIVLPVP